MGRVFLWLDAIHAPHIGPRVGVVKVYIIGAGACRKIYERAFYDVPIFARPDPQRGREKNNCRVCFCHVLLFIFDLKREASKASVDPPEPMGRGVSFFQSAGLSSRVCGLAVYFFPGLRLDNSV